MGSFVRYHGGKVRIADRIVGLFPSHETYVEPFGGGAAVLLAKPRVKLEVYNDLDEDMVVLFQVVRERSGELARLIAMTHWSRAEHELSYLSTVDPLERARRVLVRSHFGMNGAGIFKKTGFRSAGWRQNKLPVHCWTDLPDVIIETCSRMMSVVIERRPAVDVMRQNDRQSTLHYVDPPYLPETRDRGTDYRHEMTRADHEALLCAVRGLNGKIVLSGYASPLYDAALHDWRRIEISAVADGGKKRVEVLWCNFADAVGLFGSAGRSPRSVDTEAMERGEK